MTTGNETGTRYTSPYLACLPSAAAADWNTSHHGDECVITRPARALKHTMKTQDNHIYGWIISACGWSEWKREEPFPGRVITTNLYLEGCNWRGSLVRLMWHTNKPAGLARRGAQVVGHPVTYISELHLILINIYGTPALTEIAALTEGLSVRYTELCAWGDGWQTRGPTGRFIKLICHVNFFQLPSGTRIFVLRGSTFFFFFFQKYQLGMFCQEELANMLKKKTKKTVKWGNSVRNYSGVREDCFKTDGKKRQEWLTYSRMHVSSLYQKPSESRDNAWRIDGRGSTAEIRLNRGLGSRQPGRIIMMLQKPLQVCIRPASSNLIIPREIEAARHDFCFLFFCWRKQERREWDKEREREGEEESWKSDSGNHYILIKTRWMWTDQSNSEINSP